MRSISSRKPRKFNRRLLVAIAVVVIVLGIGGYVWLSQAKAPQDSGVQATPSDTAGNNGATKPDVSETTPSSQTSESVPEATTLGIEITQLDQSGGTVNVAGAVTGATEGTCVATFTTAEDRPVVKEVKATKDGNGATCGPIKIDEIQFSYLGKWQVVMTFYTPNNAAKATSATKTITIH